jgi:hypothetical protein
MSTIEQSDRGRGAAERLDDEARGTETGAGRGEVKRPD